MQQINNVHDLARCHIAQIDRHGEIFLLRMQPTEEDPREILQSIQYKVAVQRNQNDGCFGRFTFLFCSGGYVAVFIEAGDAYPVLFQAITYAAERGLMLSTKNSDGAAHIGLNLDNGNITMNAIGSALPLHEYHVARKNGQVTMTEIDDI